ncbi:MAG TPA: type IV secretion system protein [Bryobacteraceae bacterium]
MELGRYLRLPVIENADEFTTPNRHSGKDARGLAGDTGAADCRGRGVDPRHTAEESHQAGNSAGEKSRRGERKENWRRTKKFFVLARFAPLFLLSTAAYGQSLPGPQPFDFVNEITTEIDNLITAQSGILLHYGRIELAIIAVFGLTSLAFRWQVANLNLFHQHIHIAEVYEYLVKLAFVSMLMTYYVQPIPGTGISLNHLFSAIAKLLVSGVNAGVIGQLLAQIHHATHSLQHPGFYNLFDTVGYYLDLTVLAAIEIAALIINVFGFVASGILVLFGPLFLPLFLTKRFERWFWRWVDNLFTFSMYRVLAIAISFLYSSVILSFFNNAVGGNYSLGHMLALLPALLLITWSYLYSIFKIPAIASMLFGGAGLSASELTGAAIGFIVKGLM